MYFFAIKVFKINIVLLIPGNSIYQFLQRCLDTLRPEFSELKTVLADQLMYVKEDLILPHHYTFYDFIVTKVRTVPISNTNSQIESIHAYLGAVKLNFL